MFVTLIKTLFRNNKKNYFFLLVGFTMASLFLTQVFVVTESNELAIRKYIYEEGFTSASIRCSSQLAFYDYYFNNNNSFEGYTMPSEFNNVIREEIEQSPLTEKMPLSSTTFRYYEARAILDEGYPTGSIPIYVIPNEIFQYITPFANWVKDNTSLEDFNILLVASSALSPTSSHSFPYNTLFNQENVTLAKIDNDIFYSNPITFNFTHKIAYETNDFNEICKMLNTYLYSSTDSGLVITEKLFQQLLSSINATNYIDNFKSRRIFANAQVIRDYTKLECTLEEYKQIATLRGQIRDNLLEKMPLITELKVFGATSADAVTLASYYENFIVEFRWEQLRLSFLAIPIVLLLCFSIYYENQIFNSAQKKLTEFFRTHGISRTKFLTSELALLLLFAFVGLVVGVSLAIPVALLGYSSVGFLATTATAPIVITGYALQQTAIVYSSIVALFIIPFFIDRSRSFIPSNQPRERRLTAKTSQIISLVASSTITLSLLAAMIFVPADAYAHQYSTYLSIYFVMSLLTICSLAFTINLILEYSIRYLSKNLQKKRNNIIGFSLRNIAINKERFKQGLLIFTTGFLVTVLFMSLSFGLTASKSDEARYFTGADARISVASDADISSLTQSLPSTISFTEVSKINTLNAFNRHVLSFYIIDTATFPNTAYYPSGDVGLSIRKAMNYLEQTNSCLIGFKRANEIGLNIGQDYSFKIIEDDVTFIQKLEIEDFVNSWPFFMYEREIFSTTFDFNAPLELIVSSSTSQYFIDNFENLITSRYLLLDFANYNSDLEITQALVQDSEELDDLVTYQAEYQDYINDPMVRITVNFTLFSGILALLVTLSSLFFFTQKMFIDQKEQIHLYISIGAVKKQIKILFFLEVLILVILGTITGLLLGILSLNFLSKIVISPSFIGSFSPRTSSLLAIISSVLVGGIGLSLLVAYMSINWNIKRELEQYYFSEERKVGN